MSGEEAFEVHTSNSGEQKARLGKKYHCKWFGRIIVRLRKRASRRKVDQVWCASPKRDTTMKRRSHERQLPRSSSHERCLRRANCTTRVKEVLLQVWWSSMVRV